MRYLKSYKTYESSEINLYVEDIFRDLEDNGFKVFVKYKTTEGTLPYNPRFPNKAVSEEVLVDICNSKKRFRYSEISQSVEHLKSFMKGEGYQLGGYTVNHELDPKSPSVLRYPYREPPGRFPEGSDGYYYHKINFIKIH